MIHWAWLLLALAAGGCAGLMAGCIVCCRRYLQAREVIRQLRVNEAEYVGEIERQDHIISTLTGSRFSGMRPMGFSLVEDGCGQTEEEQEH